MKTTIDRMATGQSGRVSTLTGGIGLTRKLESMGLRPGKKLKKVSSQVMRGPITVMVDGRQLAMGRGIAAKVEVEIEQEA